MKRNWFQPLLGLFIFVAVFGLALTAPGQTIARAQQPTGSVPTVTGTPVAAYVTVNLDQEQINVRGGPSTYLYPPVGVLLAGQQVPATGRSPGGDWIQIIYAGVPGSLGWVYAPLVRISPGASLPIVEPPPTPTPASTPTIDPTLRAAFITPELATRMPTFTAPAPLVVPSFVDTSTSSGGIPMGLLIFGLAFIGALGLAISFVRGGR